MAIHPHRGEPPGVDIGAIPADGVGYWKQGSLQVSFKRPATLDAPAPAPPPDPGADMKTKRNKKNAEQKTQRNQSKRKMELAHNVT